METIPVHAAIRALPLTVLVALAMNHAHADVPIEITRVDASSTAGFGQRPTLGADGDIDSRWEADNNTAGTWFKLQFKEAVLLKGLRIAEHGRRLRGYRIEVEGNGKWIPVLTGSGAPPENLPLTPIWAEGVRLVTTQTAAGPPSLKEFAAWASGSSACVPQPGNSTIAVADQLDCAGTTISQPCGVMGVMAPLYVLEEGARIKNMTLIDGYVSCKGECVLENVHFRNTCPSAVSPSAVIQSFINDGLPRPIKILGGSALGRYGTLFNLNVPGSTLTVRDFNFSGHALSLNGYSRLSRNLRFKIEDVSMAGTLSAAVVRVRPDDGDRASIRRLRIYDYKPGAPAVCLATRVLDGTEIGATEQWNSFGCDVDRPDVLASQP